MDLHPYCELFPAMPADDLARLAEDIRANGLREPVITFEGKVLDGRNRLAAAAMADVAVEFKDYRGKDALAYVISRNLHRRHMDEGQRALAAARAANLQQGQKTVREAVTETAESFKVSERLVYAAKAIEDKAAPELADAVAKGEVTVSAAAEVAKLPKAKQKKIVEAGPAKVKEAAKEQRQKKAADPEPDEPAEDVDPGLEFVKDVEALCRDMDGIKARVLSLAGNRFAYSIGYDAAASQIEAARKTLWQGRPAHPCPYCDAAGCRACANTGRVKKSTADAGKSAKGGAR
ncbi:MAG TPA: hypothetical protein VM597_37145 [Gemmataceae bacterium]|nr:hypothetical protein [Gemmataceae bacterium]